jgi:hypothetical protein
VTALAQTGPLRAARCRLAPPRPGRSAARNGQSNPTRPCFPRSRCRLSSPGGGVYSERRCNHKAEAIPGLAGGRGLSGSRSQPPQVAPAVALDRGTDSHDHHPPAWWDSPPVLRPAPIHAPCGRAGAARPGPGTRHLGESMTFDDIPTGSALFVDANIFVYSFEPCRQLLLRIENKEIQGFTSSAVLRHALDKEVPSEQWRRRQGVWVWSAPAFSGALLRFSARRRSTKPTKAPLKAGALQTQTAPGGPPARKGGAAGEQSQPRTGLPLRHPGEGDLRRLPSRRGQPPAPVGTR